MSITVPEFLQSLCAASLLSEAELAALEAKAAEDSEELARELVRDGKLTKYQAAAVYQGKADTLVLGNYLILDRIGAGGMGQVFRARHRRMDRVVAIKVLSKKLLDSPDAVARFQREAKAAARLTHPNIVTAYDADEAGGTHFLVMEYVDGSDLSSLVKQQGILPVNQALTLLQQAARGLEHAHGEGVVHRDIKPSNLLVDKKGTLKILDMGLARMSDPLADPSAVPGADLTHSGSIMGTIDYMAPEQAMDSRQADARSDIYSLGCTLHYLLTGRGPYSGDTVMKRLTAHQQAAIPLLSAGGQDVPPGVQEVFSRMIAKRPSGRYQTAAELLAALEPLRDSSAAARPMPAVVSASPSEVRSNELDSINRLGVGHGPRRSRAANRARLPLAAAIVMLLAAVIGGIAWAALGHKSNEIAQLESAQPITQQPLLNAPSAKTPTAELPPAQKPLVEPISSPAQASPAAVAPVTAPAIVSSPDVAPANPPPPASAPKKTPPAAAPIVLAAVPVSPPAASDSSATGDRKLPIPGADVQREALKLLKDIYKDDYAQAKSPEAKVALAEKLLKESHTTKDDAAAMYVVLREVRNLAVDAADPALAERAIGTLSERFEVAPLKELAAALDEMSARPHPAEANHAVAEAALARVGEAQAADDLETAKLLADAAVTAARKAKDPAQLKQAVDVVKNVTAAKQQWDTWQKAKTTLDQTPGDLAANLAVGRYLCFVQGAWEQGLTHLAKGPEGPLKELAAKGLKPPTEPAALAGLGDAWYSAAEKAKGKDKADLRAGAAYWYTLAEPGLTSLAKTRIEKRLKDLGGKVAIVQSAAIGKLPETMELPVAPGVGMKFHLIPAGTFMMGMLASTRDEFQHQVNITRPFYMGVTEVTQGQWLAVTGNNPSGFPGDLERPVDKVSWDDCQQFLERFNEASAGRKFRFRLPTEAEWEYACRAGTTTKYYFGDDPDLLPQYGWFKGNSNETTHPVGQLKPNAWGLYDMHGNVYEWCSDWYGEDYFKTSPTDDPQGPPAGEKRALRGGSWANLPANCRTAFRNKIGPEIHSNPYGLRVVCEPKDQPAAVSKNRGSAGSTTTLNSGPSPSDGRTVAVAQAEIERSVATWVLSMGGNLKLLVGPKELALTKADALPSEPFVVTSIVLQSNKQVTDADLERLPRLAGLTNLVLSYTTVSDRGMEAIKQLKTLTLLALNATNITDAGLASIGEMANLTRLDIARVRITDAGLAHLRGLSQLRVLLLEDTKITDAGGEHLATLGSLTWLRVGNTQLSNAGVEKLRAALPSCKIDRDGPK